VGGSYTHDDQSHSVPGLAMIAADMSSSRLCWERKKTFLHAHTLTRTHTHHTHTYLKQQYFHLEITDDNLTKRENALETLDPEKGTLIVL